jgi:menaquinone-dependent protoporphyrinogen oxidase
MKGIIVYESRSGSAERYARWISEETGFEAVPRKKARNLSGNDVVVIGSCVRMGKPAIAGWVKKNWNALKRAPCVFYTTSGAECTDPALVKGFESAFAADMRAGMRYFPLNGKFFFKDLSWLDAKLMRMAIKMTEKSNPEEARAMAREFDLVKRENIKPIVEHVRALGVR